MNLDELEAEAQKLYAGADDLASISAARAAAKKAAEMLFHIVRWAKGQDEKWAKLEAAVDTPILPKTGSFDQ